MSETRVTQGGDLMLFVKGISGTPKSIAQATSHSLSVTFETSETTSKDAGGYWKSFDYKSAAWTATSENLVSDSSDGMTFDELFDLSVLKTPIELVFGPKADADAGKTEVPEGGWGPSDGHYWTGKGIITSLELTAQNGDNATFSVNIQGTGELKRLDNKPSI